VTTRSAPAPHGLDGRPLRVQVGILTFRRPALLARLLPQVLAQVEELREWTGGPTGVLVVDNDPEGSAREVCAAHAGVRYVHEPTPGIPAGRHRALEESVDCDLLQFIDDDEEPAPAWLVTMVRAWSEHDRPAIVAGSVRTTYLTEPSPWIVAGRFFERQQPETGTPLDVAASGNMLIDMPTVRALGVQFDRDLGLHGGSDTLFSQDVHRAGGRIIACREGAIFDLVPPEHATRRWALQRAWHLGQSRSFMGLYAEKDRRRRILMRIRLVIGGLVRFVQGNVQAVLGVVLRSDRLHARGLRWVHRSRGVMAGAVGEAKPKYPR
jgi:succinoglycan biosynthesis protein ExoM